MSDLISREALLAVFEEQKQKSSKLHELIFFDAVMAIIDSQPTAYDVDFEIRLLKNYLTNMPKVYGKRNQNWIIVRDLLMRGTSHAGMTSSIMKFHDLGIDPYGYELKGAVKDE